jgi:hypothetical protein
MLWRRLGTRLNMYSSRHPEPDGQTERVNNVFRQLLGCLCCYEGSNGQTCCLKWNLRTSPFVRLGLNTHPSRPTLGCILRIPLTYCRACDLQFQFRKTRLSGLSCYNKYMFWCARCYKCTKMRCKLVQNRRQPHTSFEETIVAKHPFLRG